MNTIKAIVSGGRVQADVPADWPDGTEVEIALSTPGEEDNPSAVEITRLLAAMDALEPLDISEAEHAAWERARQAQKDWEKDQFNRHAGKIDRMWQ